ncbi:MAG: hypothetical protein ACKOFH_13325, partial [Chthoniobacterales bacterium]
CSKTHEVRSGGQPRHGGEQFLCIVMLRVAVNRFRGGGLHDFAVVKHVSDHVIVMHHGKIVESAPAEAIYGDPKHDYTKKLLSAVPRLAA